MCIRDRPPCPQFFHAACHTRHGSQPHPVSLCRFAAAPPQGGPEEAPLPQPRDPAGCGRPW
eukprot:179870-Alexandrium_andersonii.AAC.1